MIEIIGGLITVIIGLFLKTKWDSHKIDNLEEENAAHEKKDEIIEDMGLAEVKAKEKQDEDLKNNDGSDWDGNI